MIGFFKDLESKQAKDYLAAVKDYEEYPCGVTTSEEAMKAHDVSLTFVCVCVRVCGCVCVVEREREREREREIEIDSLRI